MKFWGYSALILAVGAIIQWKWSTNETESSRQTLMARQRAVAAELGPRWYPLREKIERWTSELAAEPGAEIIDHEALKSWDFRDKAGIFLRLRVQDAKTPEAIRKGARDSLRDAFTACLMRVPNPSATAGNECKRTRDCTAGEFCNEQDHCSKPSQPFNLRVAYRTLHVLTDEWVHDAQETTSDLRVRAMVGGFDDAVRDDIPLAVEVLQKAQYYLVVLDEDVPGMVLPGADAGASAATEAIQGVPTRRASACGGSATGSRSSGSVASRAGSSSARPLRPTPTCSRRGCARPTAARWRSRSGARWATAPLAPFLPLLS